MRDCPNLPADAAPAVLDFWFGEVGRDRWFAKSDALDARIRARFAALHRDLLATRAKAWRDTPDHLLAAIIVLDQFSRNLHRGSAKAFAADPIALELTKLALDRGWDAAMPADRRQFLLMPLMHSEKIADQERALVEFERLGDSERSFNSPSSTTTRSPASHASPAATHALGRRTTRGGAERAGERSSFLRGLLPRRSP